MNNALCATLRQQEASHPMPLLAPRHDRRRALASSDGHGIPPRVEELLWRRLVH